MKSHRHTAVFALILSGILWGASVPLSKVALEWLDPAWLTVARFAIAALVLAVVARRELRAALCPPVLIAGGVGFGLSVVLQNDGIDRTSVAHASVLMGVVPVLVALASLLAGHGHASRREWASFALSALGIALIAGGGGGGATLSGDLLVLMSVALSAVLIALQPRLLAGRDPAAVTAVQFLGASLFALPVALASGRTPSLAPAAAPLLAFAALALVGTILPFWLFAFGQSRIRPQLAGAFVNLEPVVGAIIGWVLFANPVGAGSILGALAVLMAIVIAATVRTVPRRVSERAVSVWQAGVAVHAAMLAVPCDTDGALQWTRQGSELALSGIYLPDEPEPALPRVHEPV